MSSPSPSPDGLSLPFSLPPRYRVKRHLANGGMASVWCASDVELERSVAIKVLAERFAHDAEAVRRFKREARAAARVGTHPHVVTVYDVDVTPPEADRPGRAFIVMEYLAGGTVADAIRHDDIRRQEAIRWLREAASALDHAHAAGIVHRDIKPANFLLDRNRLLYIADFGIARLTSEETITSPDQLFGTAAYLSPEQALGHEATSASDRYALAVVAFELLVGERPFHAPHFSSQARQHIETPPPAASERNRSIPPAADAVLAAGLAKDPLRRPSSADELVRTLEQALGERRPIHRQLPSRRPAGPAIGAPDALTEAARGGRGRLAPSRSIAAEAERGGPRQPAPTWSPSSSPPGSGAPRKRRRLGALASLLAVFAIVGVAAAAAGGVFSGSSAHRTTDALAAGRSARRARAALGAGSTSVATTEAAANATPTAAELEATGHRQMIDGDYTQALATLKQAVSSASRGSPTYAYALYDLGETMLLDGDPQGAIPVLRQRLSIPLETAVVRATLNRALQAAAQQATAPAPTTSSSSSTPSTTTTQSTTTGHHGPTGGVGVGGPGSGGGQGSGAGSGSGGNGGSGGSGPGSGGSGGPAGGGSGGPAGGSGSSGSGGGNGGNGPGSGGNGDSGGPGGPGSGGIAPSGGAGLNGQLARAV